MLAAALALSSTGAARAESGGFFKNLFSGGGDGSPTVVAPRAFDPDDAYCPAVTVAEGAALQSFAGAQDGAHLRQQIVLGQLARECAQRADGSLSVKVGVQVRALLGPAGAPGSFPASVVIALKYDGTVLVERTRKLTVTVPAGAAQGSASVVEADLNVPSDRAVGYDIEVALAGKPPAPRASDRVAARKRKPAAPETVQETTQQATATPSVEVPAAEKGSISGGTDSIEFGRPW